MRPKVTVVLPTLEEKSIFKVVKEIYASVGRDTEIIAVARGSPEYFSKLRKMGVRVVYQRVRSVEWAIKKGFEIAHGDILATTDADATHETAGIAKGVKLVESGQADFVLGNRMRGLQEGSMSSYIEFGNKAISTIYSLLYGVSVHDVLTGLFVTKRKVYESIKKVDYYRTGIAFFAIELAKRKYRIGEVDIKYYPREFGRSKLARIKFIWGLRAGALLVIKMVSKRSVS